MVEDELKLERDEKDETGRMPLRSFDMLPDVRKLSPEQRLWLDVLCSALREAFSLKGPTREAARGWLFDKSEADYSAGWVCDAVGLNELSRIRAWIMAVSEASGRRTTKRLFKRRP